MVERVGWETVSEGVAVRGDSEEYGRGGCGFRW